MTGRTYTITELAREFDVTPRTLRYYEDQGFVKPARGAGRARVYSEQDRATLEGVTWCRTAGLSIETIKEALNLRATSRTTFFEAKLAQRRDELVDQLGRTREALDQIQNKMLPSGPGR